MKRYAPIIVSRNCISDRQSICGWSAGRKPLSWHPSKCGLKKKKNCGRRQREEGTEYGINHDADVPDG